MTDSPAGEVTTLPPGTTKEMVEGVNGWIRREIDRAISHHAAINGSGHQPGELCDGWSALTNAMQILHDDAHELLAAVVPGIRAAVAEEIAHAVEAKASDTSYSEPEEVTEHLLQAAKLAREIGGVS